MEKNLETILRIAVKERLNSGQSVLALAKSAELDWGQLRRFADGTAELRSGALAKLAIVLGFELRPIKQRRKSRQAPAE